MSWFAWWQPAKAAARGKPEQKKDTTPPTAEELKGIAATRERIRRLALFYIKFDAALFAALGTLLTFLQPEVDELISAVVRLERSFIILIICLGASLMLHHTISLHALPHLATEAREMRRVYKGFGRLLWGIAFANLLVIAHVTGYVTASAQVRLEVKEFARQREDVEWAFGRYLSIHRHAAPSLDSAFANQALAERAYHQLGGSEGVRYEVVSPKDYRITFAGWDKTFGTDDDYIASYADFDARINRFAETRTERATTTSGTAASGRAPK
ncbi:MAG: hypothetical protein ACREMN_02225 [Gemmatimonadales bacterium]